jgi:hypothetical protein
MFDDDAPKVNHTYPVDYPMDELAVANGTVFRETYGA